MLLQNVGTHPQGAGCLNPDEQNLKPLKIPKQSYNSVPPFKEDFLIWSNTVLIQLRLCCLYFFADPFVRQTVNVARISRLLLSVFSGPISTMGPPRIF
jgi:hypothetical protein